MVVTKVRMLVAGMVASMADHLVPKKVVQMAATMAAPTGALLAA